MKKIAVFLLAQLFLLGSSCIDPYGGSSCTYITIQSARGILYSFDENGIFPYFDEINRDELGISVLPDSTTQKIEYYTQNRSIGNRLYAEAPHRIEFLNSIDSVNIYTLYPFDDNHPALSKINDLLRPLNIYGNVLDIEDISILNAIEMDFKFIQSPTFDTLQFEITGRIVGGDRFTIQTNRLILE